MLLRAVARARYLQMLQAAPSTPSPRNGPVVRIGDGPADRVLLLGDGPLHGWGVTRRELSAPGRLAEVLHRRSLRATTVEHVGDERMDAASSTSWPAGAAARRHDVVVVATGMHDALRLTPVQRWRDDAARLVQRVRAGFDVATAAVNPVDGDRTRFVAGAVGAPASLPRDLARCDTAARQDEPLVVLDAKKDPRFRDDPFLALVRPPFSAGVPLHSLDGRAVATPCVLDTSARTTFDVQELQRFAVLAEQELHRLESDEVEVDVAAGPAAERESTGA